MEIRKKGESDMENKDFIRNKILEIEDFDNVDSTLLEKINEKEEYRALLDDCRKISQMVKDSAPIPEKDGVSLASVLAKRIHDGDTAPKYINTKRHFPIATVACLAVAMVVVFVAKNGISDRGANFAPETEQDFSPCESSDVVTDMSENGAANSTTYNSLYFAASNKDSVSLDTEEAAEDSREVPAVEEEKTKLNTVYTAKSELAEKMQSIDEIIQTARQLLGIDVDIISKELITELGEEKYRAFFESLQKENFKEQYTVENFRNYCN